MSRFYLDRREAAVALRDRQADDSPPSFGPHAPGVIAFIKGQVTDSGALSFSDGHINTLAAELNAGDARSLERARERLDFGMKARAHAAAEEKRHNFARAVWAWQAELAERVADAMAPQRATQGGHGSEQYVQCELGPGDPKDGRYGADGLLFASVDTWKAEVEWGLVRSGSLSALRDVGPMLPELTALVERLDAICQAARAARPEAP